MNPYQSVVVLAALLLACPALAAPKIESVALKPNPARLSPGNAAEVEVSVSISRTRFDGGCDARLDFGDGQGRTIDFGMATTRTVRHAYRESGRYTVVVKGAGRAPCEGLQQSDLSVDAAPGFTTKSER